MPTQTPTQFPTRQATVPATTELLERCGMMTRVTVEANISTVTSLLQDYSGELAVRLTAKQKATLEANLVVNGNTAFFLDGQGSIIQLGKYQFVVQEGARLCLFNVVLTDGVNGALVAGRAALTAADVGKMLTIEGGVLEVQGRPREVSWGKKVHKDCAGRIHSVVEIPEGEVLLKNGQELKNPVVPSAGSNTTINMGWVVVTGMQVCQCNAQTHVS